MDIDKYIERINLKVDFLNNTQTLFRLHEQHVYHVPFENLDIHFKRIISLNSTDLFRKIVVNGRGGFCYELNYIFCQLLNELGFAAKIISARIFDKTDTLGPMYDHMAIYVKTNRDYIADVGFGELFVSPIEITQGIQNDGRNYFKIERYDLDNYVLLMSTNGHDFQRKYIFNLEEVVIEDFKEINLFKQKDPESYFVKHIVCTKPIDGGRITIFDNKLIQNINHVKTERVIEDTDDLKTKLLEHFSISIT